MFLVKMKIVSDYNSSRGETKHLMNDRYKRLLKINEKYLLRQ